MIALAVLLTGADSYLQKNQIEYIPRKVEISTGHPVEEVTAALPGYAAATKSALTNWVPAEYRQSTAADSSAVYDTNHTYIADNPAKGLYQQLKHTEWAEMEKYEGEVKLFLITMDLYDYRGVAIPEKELADLEKCLEKAGEMQVQVIFRAGYGFARKKRNDADSLYIISDHIKQISILLNRYRDRIYCVQAGFYGPWGEWHSSTFLDGDNAAYNRAYVLRAWMEKLDRTIPICVRRPKFIREAAAMGLKTDRLGYHDDGLLSSKNDLGTYDDPAYTREQELNWINENLHGAPVGGEMPYVTEYNKAASADELFDRMNLSYLNQEYNVKVLEGWKNTTINGENAYDHIIERLGYNLFATEILYPEKEYEVPVVYGRQIILRLSNNGYAPIGDRYELLWVLADKEGARTYIPCEGTSVQDIDTGVTGEVSLDLETIRETKATAIGICLHDRGAEEITSATCIRLANDDLTYNDGIYSLLTIENNYFYTK